MYLLATAFLAFVWWIFNLLLEKWWRPGKLEAVLRRQGLRGPPSLFLTGNIIESFTMRGEKKEIGMQELSHDIVSNVIPDTVLWSKLYGKPYLSRMLSEQRIVIFDPESVREVMSKQFDNFHKSELQLEFVIDFIGHGLIGVNGEEWSHHRNVLSPAFHTQKLKGMVSTFRECTDELVEDWRRRISDGETEVEVTDGLVKLAASVISHTAFGSSYEKGQRVFEALSVVSELLIKLYFYYAWIPFFRYIPTPLNFRVWKLRREMDGILQSLVRERLHDVKSGAKLTFGNDLLGLVLEESEKASNKSRFFNEKSVMDECKTFYLAGHETTAALLAWTLLLLAINPEWQDRARAEIREHCGREFHEGDLGKLKLVGMILYETLRLYPATAEVHRAAKRDTVLNGVKVPKGTGVTIPILCLQHDKELWGENANEFRPERFAEGAAKACKHPNAFLPFSVGPRVCIGQAFALMEAKVALVVLLRSFSFRPSPNYRHNPVQKVVIHPKHGLPLLVENLSS